MVWKDWIYWGRIIPIVLGIVLMCVGVPLITANTEGSGVQIAGVVLLSFGFLICVLPCWKYTDDGYRRLSAYQRAKRERKEETRQQNARALNLSVL